MTAFFKVHDPFLISGSELLNLAELSYSSMFFWGQTGNHLHFCNSWWLEVVPDYSRLLLPWEAGNGAAGCVCVCVCVGLSRFCPRLPLTFPAHSCLLLVPPWCGLRLSPHINYAKIFKLPVRLHRFLLPTTWRMFFPFWRAGRVIPYLLTFEYCFFCILCSSIRALLGHKNVSSSNSNVKRGTERNSRNKICFSEYSKTGPQHICCAGCYTSKERLLFCSTDD